MPVVLAVAHAGWGSDALARLQRPRKRVTPAKYPPPAAASMWPYSSALLPSRLTPRPRSPGILPARRAAGEDDHPHRLRQGSTGRHRGVRDGDRHHGRAAADFRAPAPAARHSKPGEKTKPPDAKEFRQFKVAIAPEAPLGRQELRVFGPSGVSNARYSTLAISRRSWRRSRTTTLPASWWSLPW